MRKKRVNKIQGEISISDAIKILEDGPESGEITVRKLLHDNKELFVAARRLGRTSEELAAVLSKTGLPISASSLREIAADLGMAFGSKKNLAKVKRVTRASKSKSNRFPDHKVLTGGDKINTPEQSDHSDPFKRDLWDKL